jgi:hypothetical protein
MPVHSQHSRPFGRASGAAAFGPVQQHPETDNDDFLRVALASDEQPGMLVLWIPIPKTIHVQLLV